MQSYGSCHEQVIVFSVNSPIGAVLFSFVCVVFIQASLIPFDIQFIPDDLHQCRDNHWFCGNVRVKAEFTWNTLSDFVFRLSSGIQVRVYVSNLIQHVLRLITPLYLSFLIVCFERVALYDQ